MVLASRVTSLHDPFISQAAATECPSMLYVLAGPLLVRSSRRIADDVSTRTQIHANTDSDTELNDHPCVQKAGL